MPEVAGRQRSRASLRAFGKWKSWLVAKKVRTRSRPRRVGDVFGMWDQRLVRLALLQQLRAVYGIKVKGGRGQCDRRRHETAATEIKVSYNELGQGHTHFILDKKDTWLECSLGGDDQTCLPMLPWVFVLFYSARNRIPGSLLKYCATDLVICRVLNKQYVGEGNTLSCQAGVGSQNISNESLGRQSGQV